VRKMDTGLCDMRKPFRRIGQLSVARAAFDGRRRLNYGKYTSVSAFWSSQRQLKLFT
jgi:hypothetical protein